MYPDKPMQHSPYSPLGRKKSQTQDEKEALVLSRAPWVKDLLAKLEEIIKEREIASCLPDTVLADADKFRYMVGSNRGGIKVATEIKNYLQKQISAIEFSADGEDKPQGP